MPQSFYYAGDRFIEEGSRFLVSDYASDVDATKSWLVRTPASPAVIRLSFYIGASFNGVLAVKKAPSVTADGSALNPLNYNGNSTNLADLDVFKDPSFSGGTTIASFIVLGGTTHLKGSTSGIEDKMILTYGTEYVFEFTTLAVDNVVTLTLDWYEV